MHQTISIEQAVKLSSELYKQRNYKQCAEICLKILQQQNNIDVIYRLALCYIETNQPESAENLILQIIKNAKNNPKLYFQLGRIKAIQGTTSEAIKYYKKTISIDSKHLFAINNLANIYEQIGENRKAIEYYKKAISLKNDEYSIYNNLALVYKKSGQLDHALTNILNAIELKPDAFDPHYNASSIYYFLGNRTKHVEHFRLAYKLCPSNIDLAIEFHGVLAKVCAWEEQEDVDRQIKLLMSNYEGEYISPAMSDYQIYESPEKRLKATQKFTKQLVSSITSSYPEFSHDQQAVKNKIRIGYISSDIKDHAVSYLMRGVFRCHNKNDFEIYLYAINKDNDSPYRKDIASYCDEFKDISQLSNIETARQIYKDEIDILIDLNGYTGAARPEALALKPAPIQISYLGYIGTMGAEFIDYIITDEIVTPPELQQFYQEKFIYMPNCYQANDNKLEISNININKSDEGLPEDKFIFCSFNQTYKIEPVMFNCWMNILKKVPDSILWLYRGSPNESDTLAIENLKYEAKNRGVNESRLIFASARPLNEHLKRISLADLALDTRLYNGGTVTSQTLWAGVPVLTLKGNQFSSRMASSINKAIGLDELVTTELVKFEDKAVEIATNASYIKKIKNLLNINRNTKPLFNTELFTKNLESAYQKVWNNYSKGEAPKLID